MSNAPEKMPVFGVVYLPASNSLEGCVGWAGDEHEALQIVQDLPETTETALLMNEQFGGDYQVGINRERMIVQDDEGEYFSSGTGRYRYQDVFRAYLDRNLD